MTNRKDIKVYFVTDEEKKLYDRLADIAKNEDRSLSKTIVRILSANMEASKE